MQKRRLGTILILLGALLLAGALGLLGYVLVRSLRDRQTREVTAHKTSAR